MTTLVIHAPKWRAQQDARSFENTFASGVGDGYAIASRLYAQVHVGCKVVLLCKETRKRAEGQLVGLDPDEKTGNGIQRYNVRMKNLQMVPYKPESLNRNGVAVI